MKEWFGMRAPSSIIQGRSRDRRRAKNENNFHSIVGPQWMACPITFSDSAAKRFFPYFWVNEWICRKFRKCKIHVTSSMMCVRRLCRVCACETRTTFTIKMCCRRIYYVISQWESVRVGGWGNSPVHVYEVWSEVSRRRRDTDYVKCETHQRSTKFEAGVRLQLPSSQYTLSVSVFHVLWVTK